MKQYMHYLKNIFQRNFIFISIVLLTIYSCKNGKTEVTSFEESSAIKTPENMVWVESKTFLQGAKDGNADANEDNQITFKEMEAYVNSRIKKIKNINQHAVCEVFPNGNSPVFLYYNREKSKQ